MPNNGAPNTRFALMPASPPNNAGNIGAIEATISPTPSEIIANIVPARRVVTPPRISPAARPPSPPISGSTTMSQAPPAPALPAQRIAWIAQNAPSPKYTAWPNDKRPVWPSSMLYDSAKIVAIPIWHISDSAKPWVNTYGNATSAAIPASAHHSAGRLEGAGTAGNVRAPLAIPAPVLDRALR